MILYADSQEASNVIVYLNNKPVKHFVVAHDGNEGWIEVIDVNSVAPLYSEQDAQNKNWEAKTSNEGNPWVEIDHDEGIMPETDWTPLKTKKVYGNVEFRRLG